MTSLSKIIRSTSAQPKENKIVEIQIRDLFTVDFDEQESQEEQEVQISYEEIMEERDRLLADANRDIQAQREEFELYRNEQLNAIEQLKQIWEEEKLVLQKQAYDEGFQQGYEEGVQKATENMQSSIQLANETVENSRINAQKYIESQEQVILELALKSAERIIDQSLQRDDELFVSIVRRGLKEAREMKEIKIYVSLQYHQLISKNLDELQEMFPPDVPFLIFVNEDLEGTDCYIETNHGRIVVSVDEQLNELRQRLYEILNSKE